MAKKLYRKETFSSEQDWLDARAFGGSSASAILGKNPYMSKLELYKAIINPKVKKVSKLSENMAYGIKCESLIRKEFILDYQDIYKVHTPRAHEMYRRIEKPYLTATLDGILVDKRTHQKGILEIKTHDIRNKEDARNWRTKLPENYYIQVIHYLMVMNDYQFVVVAAKLRYFNYFEEGGKKLLKSETIYHYIDRKEVSDQIVALEKAETDFWENNVKKKIIPAVKIEF